MLKEDIGKHLRLRRNELNLSSEKVVSELELYGFKITTKTLYNWENGIRQPNADSFLILCKIYKIKNALQYFGFSTNVMNNEFSESEKELIRKYRKLSSSGKATVDAVIEIQYKEVEPKTKKSVI